MQTIARYLDTLKETVDGDELHGLIARTLRRYTRRGPATLECLADLHGQLDIYARDALTLPSMRIRARLLQQHIAPYLHDSEAAATPKIDNVVTEPSDDTAVPAPPPQAQAQAPQVTDKRNGKGVALEGVLERPSEQEQKADTKRVEKYQELLRSEKDAWQAIYGTVKDYQRLKNAWLKSLDELARQRDDLQEKLEKTTEDLNKTEAERVQLRDQLVNTGTETNKRSRTSSIPRLVSRMANRQSQLSKREGFVRQMHAEIRRSRRSGAPLALGLINVENLDAVVERHGTEAASAALRCYAEEILSNFRAYDVVALYDRAQFAVMFPDTRKEGAQRALEKAYKRAIETHLNHDGASFPLPPFASGLVTYSPGEDPARFLVRAQDALKNARGGQSGVAPS
jgi:diguanylate cyclase